MSTGATRIGGEITLANVTPIARDAVIAVPVSSIDTHMSVTYGRSFTTSSVILTKKEKVRTVRIYGIHLIRWSFAF